MHVKTAVKGALTYVPHLERLVPRGSTDAADAARSCYGVWLKHVTLLHDAGMVELPVTVGELGPGDSLGVGLAALLSGSDHYVAFNLVDRTDTERNLEIFDVLVELMRRRAPRPTAGWPDFDPHLDDGLFPSHILTDVIIERALQPARLTRIREIVSALGPSSDGSRLSVTGLDGPSITYLVPWEALATVPTESIDLMLSHSVLEHVPDLVTTHAESLRMLRSGGWASHQIDHESHGLADEWNGHWAFSELTWNIVVGRRPYLLNRQPHSRHIQLIDESGHRIRTKLTSHREDGISRDQLGQHWVSLADSDLTCSGTFVQATKP